MRHQPANWLKSERFVAGVPNFFSAALGIAREESIVCFRIVSSNLAPKFAIHLQQPLKPRAECRRRAAFPALEPKTPLSSIWLRLYTKKTGDYIEAANYSTSLASF